MALDLRYALASVSALSYPPPRVNNTICHLSLCPRPCLNIHTCLLCCASPSAQSSSTFTCTRDCTHEFKLISVNSDLNRWLMQTRLSCEDFNYMPASRKHQSFFHKLSVLDSRSNKTFLFDPKVNAIGHPCLSGTSRTPRVQHGQTCFDSHSILTTSCLSLSRSLPRLLFCLQRIKPLCA